MGYGPEVLVLTPSLRCNIECPHCIVESDPRDTRTLDPSTISRMIHEAKNIGMKAVAIYGGEPFLQQRMLLPYTIREAFENDLPVIIGTNGFWGRTPEKAKRTLEDMEQLTTDYCGELYIGLSVDQYHQPLVPITSIANIVAEKRLGNYPHVKLNFQSFAEKESEPIFHQLFDACRERGVYLVETQDGTYRYPATKEEIVEVTEKNLPQIATSLGLPEDSPEEVITQEIQVSWFLYGIQSVIARELDCGEGNKRYLIFPDTEHLIAQQFEGKVLDAGRHRKGRLLEIDMGYDKGIDYLVIDPDELAYSHPAFVTAPEVSGVDTKGKPLHQVVTEVGEATSRWLNNK